MLKKIITSEKPYWIAATIIITLLIIFAALVPVQKWLWLGWLYGSVSVLIGYRMNTFLLELILRNTTSKAKAMLAGFGRSILNYVLQVGLFILAIYATNEYHGERFFGPNTIKHLIDGPIEVFAYLAGLGVMTVATIASLLLRNKWGKEV